MPVSGWIQRQAFAAIDARQPELTLAILIGSCELPGTPPDDPADRIIIATARELGLAVVTRDGAILAYAQAGYVNALRC